MGIGMNISEWNQGGNGWRQLIHHTPRVLIADDCPDTRVVLSHVFESRGVLVDLVNDGESCVERLMVADAVGELFDLALVDIHMPGLSGVDAITSLKMAEIETPIVAITGNPTDASREQCEKMRVATYIDKEELYQKLDWIFTRFLCQ